MKKVRRGPRGHSCWPACLLTLIALAGTAGETLARGTYQQPADFLRETFSGDVPRPVRLMIDDELRTKIKQILEHNLRVSRLRYWGRGGRTVWVLEEIGKTQPITVGIVVNQGRIERIKVLIFRESRGWEVRHPFFTDQFKGARLNSNNKLDRRIDGISGATLSVRALNKLARLAILLHEHSEFANGVSHE